MTPLVACFPVFFLFLSIGVLAVAMLLWAGRSPTQPTDPPAEPSPRPVPVWFVVLAFLVPLAVLYWLSLVTAG